METSPKEGSSAINYEGPSPDEKCLVTASRQQGYVYQGNTTNSTVVSVRGTKKEMEVVTVFEFDNKRKMMSALVKHEGSYKLLTKGADSAILGNLDMKIKQPYLEGIKKKLSDYSKEGLRTLCMSTKILSEEEVTELNDECLRINAVQEKDKLLGAFLAKYERNLVLIGCSAVEDKLQD